MTGTPPSRWTDTITRAAWTMLLVAGVAFIATKVLLPIVPLLVVALCLVGVLALVLRRGQGGW
jgi:NhaP-type Na+/H+ or K+/H+ antiporter